MLFPPPPLSLSFCLKFSSAFTPPFVAGTSLTGWRLIIQTRQTTVDHTYQCMWSASSAAVNYTDGFTPRVCVSGSDQYHMTD